eukprot:EG_transcript_58897
MPFYLCSSSQTNISKSYLFCESQFGFDQGEFTAELAGAHSTDQDIISVGLYAGPMHLWAPSPSFGRGLLVCSVTFFLSGTCIDLFHFHSFVVSLSFVCFQ